MRYGVPYKGSKNQIAEWVCSHFPKASNFYDLFAGGCAITHCAMEKNIFQNYHANDIADSHFLFMEAVYGKFQNETRWISREDFFRLKDSEPYIKYAWSFGNNGRDYLYSKEIEPWKKALHYARVLNDFSLLEAFGIKTDKADRITIAKNADEWKKKYIEWAIKFFAFTDEEIEKYNQYKKEGVFENLIHGSVGLIQLKKRLRSLQSLESLQRLHPDLVVTGEDYAAIAARYSGLDVCFYADPPYAGTACYHKSGFDHDRFYDWLRSVDFSVYVSEYTMPEDFTAIWERRKTCTLSSTNNARQTVEKVFVRSDFAGQAVKDAGMLDLWGDGE